MILFGTAGKPINSKDIYNGSYYLEKIGLDNMEIEFVRGIYVIKKEKLNKKIMYSLHAPYFINLNAKEKNKLEKSEIYIINSSKKIKDICTDLVFHPGFYLKEDKEKVFKKILNEIKNIQENIENGIILRPETTGKTYQFGDWKEIIDLCSQLNNCLPCLDFAHIYARSLGKINTYDQFFKIIEYYEKFFKLDNIHIHLSGICYNKSGEYKHLPLLNSNFNYFDVLKVIKEFNCSGKIVCESPILEYDALLLKNAYKQI